MKESCHKQKKLRVTNPKEVNVSRRRKIRYKAKTMSGTWCNKEVGQPVCHRVRECVGQPVSQSISLLANQSVGRSVGRLGR